MKKVTFNFVAKLNFLHKLFDFTKSSLVQVLVKFSHIQMIMEKNEFWKSLSIVFILFNCRQKDFRTCYLANVSKPHFSCYLKVRRVLEGKRRTNTLKNKLEIKFSYVNSWPVIK